MSAFLYCMFSSEESLIRLSIAVVFGFALSLFGLEKSHELNFATCCGLLIFRNQWHAFLNLSNVWALVMNGIDQRCNRPLLFSPDVSQL